jgi:hypothetical protein
MEAAAEQSAQAAVVAAQAQVAAAQASASVAEAKVRQAELEGKAALASAIGQLDDAGAARLREHELQSQDRQALMSLMEQIGDVVACVDGEGKPTAKINRAAYDGENAITNTNGVAAAVRWHNLVMAQQLLADLRERSLRIINWDLPMGREETTQRIERYTEIAKRLRSSSANEAVRIIRRNRLIKIAFALGLTTASMAAGACAVWSPWNGLEFTLVSLLLLVIALFVFLFIQAGAKSKLPISWEDMTSEAGPTARATPGLVAAVFVPPILIGSITAAVLVSARVDEVNPYGIWLRDTHRLEVNEAGMTVDGSLHINWTSQLYRRGPTVMDFNEIVLHDGIVFDDKCSGSLEVRGEMLAVNTTGHEDCAKFQGAWRRASRPSSGQLTSPQRTLENTNDCDVPRDDETFDAFQRRCSGDGGVGGAHAPQQSASSSPPTPPPDPPGSLADMFRGIGGGWRGSSGTCPACDGRSDRRLARSLGLECRLVFTSTNPQGTLGRVRKLSEANSCCGVFHEIRPNLEYDYRADGFIGSEFTIGLINASNRSQTASGRLQRVNGTSFETIPTGNFWIPAMCRMRLTRAEQ